MTRVLVMVALSGCVVACSPPGPNDGGGGGTGGGGGGGGGNASAWEVTTLDPLATEATYMAMAADTLQQRIGIAYYTPRGTSSTDGGAPDYDLKYVEWKQGVVSAPQTLRFVQRKIGVAVAFHPTTGEPVVAYIGGDPGFVVGQSIYWFQSDAALGTRSGTTWSETIVAKTGAEAPCGNPVSDRGLLVGIWPAVAYDSTGKLYFAWRDGHDAQFPQQDWNGSDVELAEGAIGSMTKRCVNAGGNNKQAWGGHIQMVIGPGDQPAMIYDQEFGTSDGPGSNVIFQVRNSDGTWTSPGTPLSVGNTQTGASLAWDPTEGWGIAVLDRSTNQLRYLKSTNGVQWSAPDEVFGAGSGGWYPSLAMDPVNHEPAIAFYVCSPRPGATEATCVATEDELRVTQRIANIWRESTVDTDGAYTPKIGFFCPAACIVNGKCDAAAAGPSCTSTVPKRFVGYRDPRSGAVKLAVER